MEAVINIYNTIMGNTLYTIIAVAFLILIGYGFIKKLFKFTLIIVVCTLLYLIYVYIYKSPEEAANTLNQIGQGVEQGFNAFEDNIVNPLIKLSNPDSVSIKDSIDSLNK
tara:strand:- start:851 stop:1180 length:330 start_codon:yes stop_codon:yes gene_type:complete